MSDAATQLVLITGLSGSGKSSVAKSFEDLQYYTVDNLPLPLLRRFIASPSELAGGARKIAIVTDVRAAGFAEQAAAARRRGLVVRRHRRDPALPRRLDRDNCCAASRKHAGRTR